MLDIELNKKEFYKLKLNDHKDIFDAKILLIKDISTDINSITNKSDYFYTELKNLKVASTRPFSTRGGTPVSVRILKTVCEF